MFWSVLIVTSLFIYSINERKISIDSIANTTSYYVFTEMQVPSHPIRPTAYIFIMLYDMLTLIQLSIVSKTSMWSKKEPYLNLL